MSAKADETAKLLRGPREGDRVVFDGDAAAAHAKALGRSNYLHLSFKEVAAMHGALGTVKGVYEGPDIGTWAGHRLECVCYVQLDMGTHMGDYDVLPEHLTLLLEADE